MNNTPLDSSFQCANFESKKFYLAFSFQRNSQKTKNLICLPIFGSHTNKWGLWRELSICLTSTHPVQ
jgi:hypothetical protein